MNDLQQDRTPYPRVLYVEGWITVDDWQDEIDTLSSIVRVSAMREMTVSVEGPA
jgi:hypothetical protein